MLTGAAGRSYMSGVGISSGGLSHFLFGRVIPRGGAVRSVVVSRKYLSRTGLLEVLGNVPDAVVVAQVEDLVAAREYCERGDTDLVLVDPAVVADHRDEVLWGGGGQADTDEAVATLHAAVPRVSQLSPRELD